MLPINCLRKLELFTKTNHAVSILMSSMILRYWHLNSEDHGNRKMAFFICNHVKLPVFKSMVYRSKKNNRNKYNTVIKINTPFIVPMLSFTMDCRNDDFADFFSRTSHADATCKICHFEKWSALRISSRKELFPALFSRDLSISVEESTAHTVVSLILALKKDFW